MGGCVIWKVFNRKVVAEGEGDSGGGRGLYIPRGRESEWRRGWIRVLEGDLSVSKIGWILIRKMIVASFVSGAI